MNTHDKNGRPWAKLSEVKDGNVIELGNGFSCRTAGKARVFSNGKDLYFDCAKGQHFLSGQANDSEHLVGIYGPIKE